MERSNIIKRKNYKNMKNHKAYSFSLSFCNYARHGGDNLVQELHYGHRGREVLRRVL